MTRADACAVLPAIASLHAQIEIIAFSPDREVAPDDDRLLTAAEAAAWLHVGKNFPYEHQHEIPGARKLGAAVRFTRAGLKEYMAGTRGNGDDTQRNRSGGVVNPTPRRLRTALRGL
jgi:excisionase family DNA binding protein